MELIKVSPETHQHMKKMVDGCLSDLIANDLLIKESDTFENWDENVETVYSLSRSIAHDLAETHENEGTIEDFQMLVLDYIEQKQIYENYF